MDNQDKTMTELLCDRHRIRIIKLNIGEDCSLNRRTLCSQCLNVERTIQLNELDRIVKMNLTEVRNDLNNQMNQFKQQKKTLIQYLDQLSNKYEQEYQNIITYYDNELFQDFFNNRDKQAKITELQLLAERLVTRLDKFNKLQITPANLNPINQLNDLLINLIEHLQMKVKNIVKLDVVEVENKQVSLEKCQTITNLDIRNVNCICTNHSQNYLLLTGEGADKIIQYEFENGEWQPIQVIPEKEIHFIDHHPLINQFVCCNFKQQSIKIYQQIKTIWSVLGHLQGKTFELPRAKYNHDGNIIATTDESLQIQFWKYNKGSYDFQSNIESNHSKKIRVLEFNQNSSMLASGSWDCTIHIYIHENDQWKFHQRLKGHTGLVNGLCFRNNILSSCSDDKNILIWMKRDSEFFECTQTISNHTDFVTCLDFNRDNSIFVSGSSDHTIRIWRRNKNQKEYQLEFLHRQVESTRIKSIKILESNTIVAGDLKNTAFIYQLKL